MYAGVRGCQVSNKSSAPRLKNCTRKSDTLGGGGIELKKGGCFIFFFNIKTPVVEIQRRLLFPARLWA